MNKEEAECPPTRAPGSCGDCQPAGSLATASGWRGRCLARTE